MSEIAILMAAGMGMRMRPLTETMPKPLIQVNGTPMIETVIEGLLRRPVSHIYIVTGYMKEKFSYLKHKYPQIELVENTEYQYKNNISSLYATGETLGSTDCFICEADLWIPDPSIFQGEFIRSCYYAKSTPDGSEDWGFVVSGNRITRVKKGGGNLFQMVGLSYFRWQDALLVRKAIQQAYRKPGHETLFWDEIVDQNLHKLDLDIRMIHEGQVVELDTVEELAEMDAEYQTYLSR